VVATGPFSRPFVPPIAAGLASSVKQLHTAEYRFPAQLPEQRVVVVGGGNSGFQIAAELATAGRDVVLSEGRRSACIPPCPFGRDVFWWQDKTGVLRITADSWFGRLMAANDGTVVGSTRSGLRRLGVTLRPRSTAATGTSVTFDGGISTEVDAFVWATGFRIDDAWIRIPEALDRTGRLIQHRGFVQHDAAWIADLIAGSRTTS
jgi:putative flavoprotein involved in K+ transport